MQDATDRPTMARIAAVGSASEANIICAILAGEGIEAFIPGQTASGMLPHLSNALNPDGIEVHVPFAQLDRAKEILESAHRPPPGTPHPAAPAPSLTGETYARKALATAGYSWLLVPFLLLAGYYAIRALRAPAIDDPVSMAKRRRYLFWAVVIALPNILLWMILLWRLLGPTVTVILPDGTPIEEAPL